MEKIDIDNTSMRNKKILEVLNKWIPKQLQNEEFRFTKKRRKNEPKMVKLSNDWIEEGQYLGKEPYVSSKDFPETPSGSLPWNWRKNQYRFNDIPFIKYLNNKDCEGYGLVLGYGDLVVVDFDSKWCIKNLLNKIYRKYPTFTIKTGSGKIHLYYKVKQEKPKVVYNIFEDEVLHTGIELRGEGCFIVGPNSKHPKGGLYSVYRDNEIFELESLNQLKEIIEPLMPEIPEDKKENIPFVKNDEYFEKGIERIWKAQLYEKGMNIGNACDILGIFPNANGSAEHTGLHDSENGVCLTFPGGYPNGPNWKCWHCERDGSKFSGNAVELIAVTRQIPLDDAYQIMAKHLGVDLITQEQQNLYEENQALNNLPKATIEEIKEHKEHIEKLKEEEEFSMHFFINGQQFQERDDIEKIKYWLYPIIPKTGHITLLAGNKGCGKSMFSLKLADAITKNNDFLVWKGMIKENNIYNEFIVPSAARVAYIDGEMSPASMQQRTKILDINDNLYIYQYKDKNNPDKIGENILRSKEYRDFVLKKLIQNKFDVVFLDNIVSLFVGVDMNKEEAWSEMNQWLLELRKNNICVFLIHHMGKDSSKGARGTSHIYDNVDDTLYLINKRKDASEDIKFELRFEHFREHVEDSDKFLRTSILSFPSDICNFVYCEKETSEDKKRKKEKDLFYRALKIIEADPDILKSNLRSYLKIGVNNKIVENLEKEKYITVEGRQKTLTELGRSYIKIMDDVDDNEILNELE